MPRAKRTAASLTLGEFDKLADTIAKLAGAVTDLVARTRDALIEGEASRQLVDKLASVGFFASPKPARSPSANGGAKRAAAKPSRRRRHHSRIDPSKVIDAVKKAGAQGATAGQVADTLGVKVDAVRSHLYQLRDAGTLKMVGKRATAKYVLAAAKSSAVAKAAKPATPAKSHGSAETNGASKSTSASESAERKNGTAPTNGVAKKRKPAKDVAAARPA